MEINKIENGKTTENKELVLCKGQVNKLNQ